jgi:hypothetical protein
VVEVAIGTHVKNLAAAILIADDGDDLRQSTERSLTMSLAVPSSAEGGLPIVIEIEITPNIENFESSVLVESDGDLLRRSMVVNPSARSPAGPTGKGFSPAHDCLCTCKIF